MSVSILHWLEFNNKIDQDTTLKVLIDVLFTVKLQKALHTSNLSPCFVNPKQQLHNQHLHMSQKEVISAVALNNLV